LKVDTTPAQAGKGDDMKSLVIKALVLTGSIAVHSHAIFGLGAHWAPAPGVEIKSNTGVISPAGASNTLSLSLAGSEGLQGLGAKFWIDFLPFIDLEVASSLQFGYYDLTVIQNGNSYPVDFDLGIPGLKDSPFYARSLTDIAVLYPVFKFPPAISVLKLYAGGGLTFGTATQTLDASFAKNALANASASAYDPATDGYDEAIQVLVDAIEDEGMISGMGFFLQAGAHAKLPIIPIAAYADAKYRFGGNEPELIDGGGMTYELGLALAF
jgi:hypothetical protein